ncbi:MAG: outer membrane protein assembly factor BamB family protein [Planctomycetota bacterium]|jgi:outer membrane protein assembly factor BamB
MNKSLIIYLTIFSSILQFSSVLVQAESKESGFSDFVVSGKPLDYWISSVSTDLSEEELDATVEALSSALSSDDIAVRVAAADALAVLGPRGKAAVPALVSQLSHEQGWVRVAAMGALISIGKDSVPELAETIKTDTGAPRIRAALVLGSIGPDAKEAVPVLAATMPNLDEINQGRFLMILSQIDPEQYPPSAVKPTGVEFDATQAMQTSSLTLDALTAGNWSQFHGPMRDSVCREKGLLKTWPEGGPRMLWTVNGLGNGYSSVSIDGNRLFTMGDRKNEEGEELQYVSAFDIQNQKLLWATVIGPPHSDGTRSTPAVDGELVFALGTEGDIVCLEAATGTIRWKKNLVNDFGGVMMSGWKFSESPLVDGDKVICTPGGKEAGMAALDKQSGDTIWKCALPDIGDAGKDGTGYSSTVAAEICGVRQYVQLLGRGVIGIDAETGNFLWGYNRIANTTANIPMPVISGNYVFVTTAYNTGAALLKIVQDGETFEAQEVYFIAPREFQNHHGGIVVADGYVYGGHGTNRGDATCIEFGSGKIMWKERGSGRGSASVLYADGNIILRYDRGEVLLVEATAEAFRLKGRFEPPLGEGPAWAHPVIYNGRLYLRHGDILSCFDVREFTELSQ